jgi:hypothetical protein
VAHFALVVDNSAAEDVHYLSLTVSNHYYLPLIEEEVRRAPFAEPARNEDRDAIRTWRGWGRQTGKLD